MNVPAQNTFIQLLDPYQIHEPFIAYLEEATPDKLVLLVPNTTVRFSLYRRRGEAYYSGHIGGRSYVFLQENKADGAR